VAHAPTADVFAFALAEAITDPTAGIATGVRYGAQADHLAAAAEAYSLAPGEAATLLADAGATPHVAVEAIHALCDQDRDLTAQVAGPALGLEPDQVGDLLDTAAQGEPIRLMTDSPDPTDANSLLAQLPEPEPALGLDLDEDSLIAMLPEPDAPHLHAPEATP
jgi:hypothetical protein